MNEGFQHAINIPAALNYLGVSGDPKPSLYFLKNKEGMLAAITNQGGKLVSLLVPDNAGRLIELVDNIRQIADSGGSHFYQGTLRPEDLSLKSKINHEQYITYMNTRLNNLCRCENGLTNVLFKVNQLNNTKLELTYYSIDYDDGLPGDMNIKITYTMSAENGLKVSHEAIYNREVEAKFITPILFNLNGTGSGSVLNHILQINADNFIARDISQEPAWKVEDIMGTPFDFRKATAIGARINDNNGQLKNCNGYNHHFLLNKHGSRTPVARIKGDKTGIVMEICTDDPALLFYSGDVIRSNNGATQCKPDSLRTAFAMETRYVTYPKAQGQPVLKLFNPGQLFKTAITYRFKTSK
jgi:aldose 1-epimerase